MNWKKLKSEAFEVYRAAVPGGWLVLVTALKSEQSLLSGHVGGLTFLPDAGHAWDGSDPLASPLGQRKSE